MTHIRLPTPIASLRRHQVQQIKFALGLKAYSGTWKNLNIVVFRLRKGRPRNLDAILRYRKVKFCRLQKSRLRLEPTQPPYSKTTGG